MSRTLPTGLATALAASSVAPAFLVSLDWPTGVIYLWNGYADLTWGGHTYLGLGDLGGISEIKESADLTANGTVLTLSGIPSANVAEALRNDSQGRSAKIYFGVISGGSFAIDPYLVFDGLIDAPSMSDDGTTATINITLEKEFIDNRSNARRYTDQDQRIDYPADDGLQYVAGLATQVFTWGKVTVGAAPSGGTDPSNQINPGVDNP